MLLLIFTHVVPLCVEPDGVFLLHAVPNLSAIERRGQAQKCLVMCEDL